MSGVPAPVQIENHPEPALRTLGAVLRRYRWLLLLALAVGVGGGVGAARMVDPSYEASTLVMVGQERVPNLSAAELLGGQLDARQIATEMELLRSRALAKAVVDSLDLQVQLLAPRSVGRGELFSAIRVEPAARSATYRLERQRDGGFLARDAESDRVVGRFAAGEAIRLPHATLVPTPAAARRDELELAVLSQEAAVEALAKALTVEQPSREVNLIRVSYRGPDPELARDIPNALTARFIALRESMHKSEARSLVTLLKDQLETLASQLSTSEERLRSFRESARVIDPQLEASTQVSHVAELQAQRVTLETERSSMARLVAELEAAEARSAPGAPSPYRRMIAFPSMLRNQATGELLRSLAAAEDQRSQLATRRTPQDPEYQVVQARIRELEQQLKGIASTYLSGLNSQVASMDASLGQYRAQLARTPATEVEFARLSRQPKVLQEMYGLLQTRLKEAEIAQSVEDTNVRVVDVADLPSKPITPGAGLLAGASGMFMLLLAFGGVLAKEYADGSVRTRADLQAALGIPVLGLIPAVNAGAGRWRVRSLPGARLLLPAGGGKGTALVRGGAARDDRPLPAMIVRSAHGRGPATDAYVRLHANILFARPDVEPKILLFTSPLPGDGKTTTALNLATTLAESGLKVLLIDADLRRGSVHRALGAERGPGLTNLLAEAPTLEGVLRREPLAGGQSLRYITAGDPVANPVHLLSSPATRELLRVVSQVYDRVIIDSPPLNLFPDAALLSACADGVVVVARAGITPFDALVDTAEELRRAGGNTLGAVLNGVDFQRDAAYDRSYRWYGLSETYAEAAAPRG